LSKHLCYDLDTLLRISSAHDTVRPLTLNPPPA
jgi:hypothetical protein